MQADKGVREDHPGWPTDQPCQKQAEGRGCEDAASGLVTPLVILWPRKGLVLEGSSGGGNGNETAWKVIEKAAGNSGYDLNRIPPG